MSHVHTKICFGLKIVAYPKSMNHHHFRLKFCYNKNIGLGKKSKSKKLNQTRSKKIVLNFNQNWLDIRMDSKFW